MIEKIIWNFFNPINPHFEMPLMNIRKSYKFIHNFYPYNEIKLPSLKKSNEKLKKNFYSIL